MKTNTDDELDSTARHGSPDRMTKNEKMAMVIGSIIAVPLVAVMAWIFIGSIGASGCVQNAESSQPCRGRVNVVLRSVERLDTSTPAGQVRASAKAYRIEVEASRGRRYFTEEDEAQLLDGRNMILVQTLQSLSDALLDEVAAEECRLLAELESAEQYKEQRRMGRGAYLIRVLLIEEIVPVYCPENKAIMTEVVALR